MLLDDTSTVNANNLSARERLSDESQGFSIQVWLFVGGTEYSPVDHEEVGVSGGQSDTLKYDGPWHRQFDEAIGLSLQGAEGLQLFFHP